MPVTVMAGILAEAETTTLRVPGRWVEECLRMWRGRGGNAAALEQAQPAADRQHLPFM
jgi:hypothetical protein